MNLSEQIVRSTTIKTKIEDREKFAEALMKNLGLSKEDAEKMADDIFPEIRGLEQHL